MHSINPDNFPTPEDLELFLNDLNSINVHKMLIKRAVNVVKTIPRVEGVLLKGSLAKNGGDLFSDIDFAIIHSGEETAKEEILESLFNQINKIGSVIHIYYSLGHSHKDPIIIFHPLIKFEVNIRDVKTISSSWKTKNSLVLFDKNGHIRQAVGMAKEIEFDLSSFILQIENFIVAFPTFCYMSAGYHIRGEEMTLIEGLQWMRGRMLTISGWLLGFWDEGPRRAELRFPPEVIQFYKDSLVWQSRNVWNAIDILIDWYSSWIVPKVEDYDILPAKDEIRIIQQVLDILKTKVK